MQNLKLWEVCMPFDYEKYLEKKKKEKKFFNIEVKLDKPLQLSRERTRTRLAGGDFKEYHCAESAKH